MSSWREQASPLISQYVDPTLGYSFNTYDRTWADAPRALLPEDVLAANLLNLRLSAPDVIPLFSPKPGDAPTLLAAMNRAVDHFARLSCPFEDFPALDSLDSALEPLAAANRATRSVPGWTPVTVSKVLHRHAPHVIPIIDSRLRAFYDVRPGQEYILRHRLWADLQENRDWLKAEAAKHNRPDGRPMSLLRAADIVIWMSWKDWSAKPDLTHPGHPAT